MAHANWMTLGLTPVPRADGGIDQIAGQQFSASGNYAFWPYCVTQPRKIVALGVNVRQVTPPSAQYRLSLWSLDNGGGGGNPSPTPGQQLTVAGNPVQTANFTPSSLGFQWFSLPSSVQYTPTRGQFLGVKLEQLNSGNGAQFGLWLEDYAITSFPLTTTNMSANAVDRYPVVGLKFDGTTQPTEMGNPAELIGLGAQKLTATNAGERLAMRFKFTDAGRGGSFKIAGLRVQGSACTLANQGKFRVGLWQGTTDMLLQYADIGFGQSAPANEEWGYRDLFFTNSVITSSSSSSSGSANVPRLLFFNTPYYIGLERLSGAQNPSIAMNYIGVSSANSGEDMGAYSGGIDIYAAKWTNAGGTWHWEEFKNRRPLFDLILADLTQF